MLFIHRDKMGDCVIIYTYGVIDTVILPDEDGGT